MLLTKEEIKQQTRQLWKTCFNDSEEFMDIYFEEKYADEYNHFLAPDGTVAAAMQLFPHAMTFHGKVLHAGYVSGLGVLPEYRGRGMAARLLREAHRQLYNQGRTLSFLIPANDALRHFYEQPQHGAYWTSTFRYEVELKPTSTERDERIVVEQPDEWGRDLYVFYNNYNFENFMLRPYEHDFYAAIEACDLAGGYVLVARRKRRVVGICLAVTEADGRLFVRSLLTLTNVAKDALLDQLKALAHKDTIYARVPAPAATKGSMPYAMARVVNVEHFLSTVVHIYPDFQIRIGVDGDLDVPENNGYYLIRDGRLSLTESRPDTIVTPGGLAAMFLSSHRTYAEMLLDE